MSSRTQHDRRGRSDRDNNPNSGGYGGHADRDGSNVNNMGVPPAVPGFGFTFPGMPMFPPGFMMGGAGSGAPSQSPHPGH